MSYQINSGPKAGRFADTEDLDLSPGATIAAAGTTYSAAKELGDRKVARLKLDVTAHTAAGDTLDVTIQTSRDGVTYYDSGSFTQSTGVAAESKLFMLDRFVRAKYVVADTGGGGVSVTFTVSGEAA